MSFYKFATSLISLVFFFIFRIKIHGHENIPKDSRAIICANHASMLDPVFVGISIKRQVHFMTKKEMFKNRFLDIILRNLGAFPVDRQGADLTAIKKAIKVLRQENILGIFPEGTRVKGLSLENAKPGIGMLCVKGKSPVVPVYIDTTYKFFSKVDIYVGEPLDFSESFGKKLTTEEYRDISKTILEKIYELKN